MAPPAGTLRVGRYFLALGILLAVLYGLTFYPGKGATPKLGLDLVGGAQVVLKASTANGTAPTKDAMNEARQIIEDRVNGRGVSNSQVAIEGSDRITVTIPGQKASDISDIGQTALLTFRPLIAGPFAATAPPAATTSPTASGPATAPATGTAATPTGKTPTGKTSATIAPTKPASSGAPTTPASGASPQDDAARPIAAATTPAAAPASTPAATPAPSTPAATGSAPAPGASGTPASTDTGIAPVPSATAVTPAQISAFEAIPASATGTNASQPGYSTLSAAQKQALVAFQCGKTKASTATDQPIIGCSQDNTTKYVLAEQLFPGTEVKDASAVAPNAQTAAQGWTVALDLRSSGAAKWAEYTGQNNCGGTSCTAAAPPADYVAFTLDGEVITAPGIQSAITGQTQISGSFTQASATNLANSLKYGALPLSFSTLTTTTVSATLGTAQLEAGLLAGGIGLALVVLYSLLYYRGLGLVTLASLGVSGGIVYASLVILGRNIGFTLTLAGVAGFIVAVGITADSFVVFFERIKDEVHEGRSMRVAVPRAWIRARRTIISADVVSLLAALVLYYLAAGDVRGFAFTLGLSTIIDVIVVFWFTHPVVSLLSRSRTFGSKRFTGLDSVRTGPSPAKPAPVRRSAPATVAARPAAGSTRIQKKPATSSVAVLEREDETPVDDDVVVETVAEGPVVGRAVEPVVEVDDDAATDAAAEDEATEPRRRTTPESGSAAARAAARRAKLRTEKEDGA